jgi:hypothetical protein
VTILVIAQAEGLTAERDVDLVKIVELVETPPPGARIRMAGPIPGGYRIVSLWDSQEEFEVFLNERLLPALAVIGRGLVPYEIWPIDTTHALPSFERDQNPDTESEAACSC